MKQKSIRPVCALCLALLVVVALLFGCKSKEAPTSSAGSSSSSAPSSSSSKVESSSSEPEASSSSSSEAESSSSNTYSSVEPAHSEPPASNNATFNEVFAQNPIDKAYKEDSKDAVSTQEMVELADRYAQIWSYEINYAYDKLMGHLSTSEQQSLQKEQDNWYNGLESAIEKIYSDAVAESTGTIAQLTASSNILEYYKSRAVDLYLRLFEYEPELTYYYEQ